MNLAYSMFNLFNIFDTILAQPEDEEDNTETKDENDEDDSDHKVDLDTRLKMLMKGKANMPSFLLNGWFHLHVVNLFIQFCHVRG